MSEPRAIAETVEEVVTGVWTWSVHDDRIDFVSAAHAVSSVEGTVLIDPLPLASDMLAGLGEIAAICITSGSHQRSAWRYRSELGADVYAPALSRTLEEEPDGRYGDGDSLPGGLLAVFTPGAGTTQHTLVLERAPGVAFVPDLLANAAGNRLAIVWDEYMDDPREARRSIRKLLDLPVSILCLAHGTPVTEDAKRALGELLERDELAQAES